MAIKLATDTFISINGSMVQRTGPAASKIQEFIFNSINTTPVKQNTLVTPWAAKEMIKKHFEAIWEDARHKDDTLAVEFDRQSILLILAQNGCEGIRFSFCNFDGKPTLVAFGIDQTGRLIAENMFKDNYSPMPNDPPPPGSEQGHGVTLEEFKKTVEDELQGLAPSLGKINDIFWSYTI